MTTLDFNFQGYLYGDGLRNLRRMFHAATDGINRHLQAAYDELDAYDRAISAGSKEQVERTEDGYVIEDHRDVLIYHTTTAEEAKSTLNKSIVLSLFHHWERSAREWTGRPNGKFATLCDLVTAIGYPISPRLREVQLLANLMKHANEKHGIDLHAARPGLFPEGFDPKADGVEWFDALVVSDATISEIFDILAASGPNPLATFGVN